MSSFNRVLNENLKTTPPGLTVYIEEREVAVRSTAGQRPGPGEPPPIRPRYIRAVLRAPGQTRLRDRRTTRDRCAGGRRGRIDARHFAVRLYAVGGRGQPSTRQLPVDR